MASRIRIERIDDLLFSHTEFYFWITDDRYVTNENFYHLSLFRKFKNPSRV